MTDRSCVWVTDESCVLVTDKSSEIFWVSNVICLQEILNPVSTGWSTELIMQNLVSRNFHWPWLEWPDNWFYRQTWIVILLLNYFSSDCTFVFNSSNYHCAQVCLCSKNTMNNEEWEWERAISCKLDNIRERPLGEFWVAMLIWKSSSKELLSFSSNLKPLASSALMEKKPVAVKKSLHESLQGLTK